MGNVRTDFRKILVARESPSNKCMGPEGEWLIPATEHDRAAIRVPRDEHFFVTIRGRMSNLFGWVSEIDHPLTPEELRSKDAAGLRARLGDDAAITLPPLDWYKAYLESVAKQGTGTPMACHFMEVRLPGAQKRSLRVHKVIFYEAP